MNTQEELLDFIIIGAGTAGLAAGLYAGRYQMKTLIVSDKFGGETSTAGSIENYPGVKPIDGYDLMKTMKEQTEEVGATIVHHKATKIERDKHCFRVWAGDEVYHGSTLLLAVGAERRHLGLEREEELTGKGVHYCVTCDGPLYGGKVLGMVGGGDASVKGVNLAAEYAEKIYLIVRGTEINAEPVNYDNMKALGDKVEVLFDTEVDAFLGKEILDGVRLTKEHNGSTKLPLDALFVEIGAKPDVELAVSLGVELDERGYIKVDNMMKTNVDGIFAAGDTVNHFQGFKQAVTAAAMGAVAATAAYEDHKAHGELCLHHKVPEKLAAKNAGLDVG